METFQNLSLEEFESKWKKSLENCHVYLNQLLTKNSSKTSSFLETFNNLSFDLDNIFGETSTLGKLHPNKELRDNADAMMVEARNFLTELSLNSDLYQNFSSLNETKDPLENRLIQKTIEDFKRSGVDKDEKTRDEIKILNQEMTILGQDFSRNIIEDLRFIELNSKEELNGLPQDYIDAKVQEKGPIKITTNYPDYIPFMTYAENQSARKNLFLQFNQRGFPKNQEILNELIEKRGRLSSILGFNNWAELTAANKMIKSGQNIEDFVLEVAQLAEGRAKDDKNKLSSLKKDLGFGDQELQDWEKGYLSQQMKKKHYNFDSQKAREFFSFPKVKEGLLKLAAKLFGVEYLESTDSVWHEEVSVYWVIKGGQKIGKIFLDMHPREGKYKHAAVMPQKKGSRGKSVSEVALVCNFSKALIEHKQVVTFFHEFGHLMHAILGGGKNWARFSGIATEWDFVEVPSQLFEELAWDYDVLKEFAFHFETNEEIPKELVHNMKKANDFGKGIQVRQQMFYAMISLRFHQNPKENLLNILQETQKQFSPCPYISDTYFHLAFGHLIGYTAAYYTYMWSWAIALELLERFKTEGLLNSKTWNAYNEEILIPGGTKDATELIHNFLNRSHSLDGLKNWLKN